MRSARAAAVALVAVLAVAGCGDSPEDQARDNGKDVGTAVRHLADASSISEAQKAAGEIRESVSGLDTDTRDHVQDQIDTQRDTLVASVDKAKSSGSFEGAKTALHQGAQDVRAQADSFRSGTNSIANEFWRGFEEGYDDAG
jgi:hypothetical protein